MGLRRCAAVGLFSSPGVHAWDAEANAPKVSPFQGLLASPKSATAGSLAATGKPLEGARKPRSAMATQA